MTYDRASGALMERFKKLMAIVQPNDKGDNGPDEDDGGAGGGGRRVDKGPYWVTAVLDLREQAWALKESSLAHT